MRISHLKTLALLAAPLALAACSKKPGGTPTADGGKRYKIGFANLDEQTPFGVLVRQGIEKAAKEAGNVDLVKADNQLSGARALDNANNFITQGVQGVIEFQTDESVGKAIMDKFDAAKIPVIAIDIPMPGATFFGVNNYPAGHMAGAGLGKWVKENWGGEVDALVMLELPQSGPVPAERLRGEREGLESVVGKIPETKVRHLDSKNTLEEARRLMADTLTTMPNARHVAVVCINDDTALGAINAAETAGRADDIAVVAVDASPRGRETIRKANSRQIGSTASFPEKYGEKLIPAIIKAIDGEKLPEKFYTEHVFITKANVDKYYPDDKK
jgi:ribose transport system substrate-binding protein